MKEITIKVYEFNELSEEAQDKAIRLYMEEFQNDKNEMFQEMVRFGFLCDYWKEIDFEYSLSYCQGDGFCFYSKDNQNLPLQFLQMQEEFKSLPKALQEKLESFYDDISIYWERTYTGYAHKYTVRPYFESFDEDSFSDEDIKLIESMLLECLHRLCDQYEELGYDTIYQELTIDFMGDISEENGWFYHEDGTFYVL